MMESKNREMLDSFCKYCENHPTERFWQALRNWAQSSVNSDINFILVADSGIDAESGEIGYTNVSDTFYWD